MQVRFIEFMPLDPTWLVPRQGGVGRRHSRRQSTPCTRWGFAHAGRAATRYATATGGEIGVVRSVTRPFWATATHPPDRRRQIRACLFALDEHDVRPPLRTGGTDDDVAAVIERAVGLKWAGHHIGQVTFIRPSRSMSQIGG